MHKPITLLLVSFAFACSAGPVVPDAGLRDTNDASTDAGSMHFAEASTIDAHADATSCDAPDMLVILDRSDSMTSMVGNSGTRIDLAVAAIEHITAPPTDTAVRFGLQVLPQVNGAECSTEVVIPIGASTGASIASSLSSMSPQTDYGTPIGVALQSADATLAKSKVSGRA